MDSTTTGDGLAQYRGRRPWRVVLALAAVAAAAGGSVYILGGHRVDQTAELKPHNNETDATLDVVPEWKPLEGFAGSQACRQCHPSQFETYLQTAHSRALTEV